MNQEALRTLASLKGQTFKFLTGSYLTSNLMTDHFVVVTDDQAVSVLAEMVYFDTPAIDDEMSGFLIDHISPSRLAEIVDEKNRFLAHCGEAIEEVQVCRELISCFKNGECFWDYLSDTAIVLQVQTGYIRLNRRTHYDEVMSVRYYRDKSRFDEETTDSLFESNEEEQFEFELSNHPIATLLSEDRS
jgi:hypothetical protein